MATVTKLGPADHGRPITDEELRTGDYEPGFKYELIDGRLYVSYQPDLPERRIELWVLLKLVRYAEDHPAVINYVHPKARVFVTRRRHTTIPEPDVAAYRNFPVDLPLSEVHWEDVSPVLVVEVLSAGDPDKDLVRNVRLYLQVPSIREYWVLDNRDDTDQPTMRVYRRRGQRWQRPIELAYRDRYTTKLLPDFELIIDPRR